MTGPTFDNRNDAREWMRRDVARYSDSVLALALRTVARDVLTRINRYGHGLKPLMDQSRWDAMEVITKEAMDRFDRLPDSPSDLLIEELASATWCVIHETWVSHHRELTLWPMVYGRLLAADVAMTEAMARSLPDTVADPLADYETVEGGYRWFHDGRLPEPV